MAKIAFRHSADVARVLGKDAVPENLRGNYSTEILESVIGRYFHDGDETLELFEVTFPPDTVIEQHAHTSAEIVYVLHGEIHFGARVCGPGSAVFVNELVLYGFRSGPQGVTFLNFRGVPRPSYLTKEQYLQLRSGDEAEESR